MRCSSLRAAFTIAAIFAATTTATAGEKDRWTGFYVGGHLGSAWTDANWTWNIPDNANIPLQTDYISSSSKSSFAGGAQFGYQHRIGMIVPGIEVSYTGHSATGTTVIDDGSGDIRTLRGRVGNIFTAAARLGIAHERWLGYVKGGVSWAQVELESTRASDGATETSSSGLARGFTYGTGLEYALTNNISLGGEYNYTQVNVTRSNVENTALGVTASSQSSDPTIKTLMMRLNYKLN